MSQYCYISTDSGQLLKALITVVDSRFQVEFTQLPKLNPILMIGYLGKFKEYDILALFGDLCEGAIVKVGNDDVCTLKTLYNTSPALDSVLVSGKTSSRLILTCGSRNGQLIEYKKGLPVVNLASSNNGFEGVTGIWSLKKSEKDFYHSFLVISFIEETRVMQSKGIELNIG